MAHEEEWSERIIEFLLLPMMFIFVCGSLALTLSIPYMIAFEGFPAGFYILCIPAGGLTLFFGWFFISLLGAAIWNPAKAEAVFKKAIAEAEVVRDKALAEPKAVREMAIAEAYAIIDVTGAWFVKATGEARLRIFAARDKAIVEAWAVYKKAEAEAEAEFMQNIAEPRAVRDKAIIAINRKFMTGEDKRKADQAAKIEANLEANKGKIEANRAKIEAEIEANIEDNRGNIEANRAKIEADKAKREADKLADAEANKAYKRIMAEHQAKVKRKNKGK